MTTFNYPFESMHIHVMIWLLFFQLWVGLNFACRFDNFAASELFSICLGFYLYRNKCGVVQALSVLGSLPYITICICAILPLLLRICSIYALSIAYCLQYEQPYLYLWKRMFAYYYLQLQASPRFNKICISFHSFIFLAFHCNHWISSWFASATIMMGGFVNTRLRS